MTINIFLLKGDLLKGEVVVVCFFFCRVKFSKELISFLGHASKRAFHENPNRIHTELTFINP